MGKELGKVIVTNKKPKPTLVVYAAAESVILEKHYFFREPVQLIIDDMEDIDQVIELLKEAKEKVIKYKKELDDR